MSASQVRVAVRAGRDEAEVYGMEWNGMVWWVGSLNFLDLLNLLNLLNNPFNSFPYILLAIVPFYYYYPPRSWL